MILFINGKPRPEEFLVEKYGFIRSLTSPLYPGPLSKKTEIIVIYFI